MSMSTAPSLTPQAALTSPRALPGILAIAGAALAMATGFGSLVLPSVMAGPLTTEMGWSLGEISLGYAIAAFGMAAGGLLWGGQADRTDMRILLVIGSLFTVTPIWTLAHVTSLWQFHAAHAVLGLLGFGCLYPAVVCAAAAWFPQRRGLVMGIVTAGGAVGQGIMPYVADALLRSLDWRATYLTLAAAVGLVQLAVVVCVRRPRLSAVGLPLASKALRLRDRPRVFILAAAAFFCCACMGVPLIHLVGHVTAICGNPGTGATAMLIAMSAGAVGRIAYGMFADRTGNLAAYFAASAQQTLCLMLMPFIQSEASILVLSAAFGFGFAGNMTCLLLCIRDEAPAALYGRAMGIVMFIAWVGMGLGGYLGGALTDLSGTYNAGFWLAVGFGVVNLGLIGLLAGAHKTARRSMTRICVRNKVLLRTDMGSNLHDGPSK